MSKIQDEITATKGWATSHVVIMLVIAFVAGLIVEGLMR
jgi:hypothetical protein